LANSHLGRSHPPWRLGSFPLRPRSGQCACATAARRSGSTSTTSSRPQGTHSTHEYGYSEYSPSPLRSAECAQSAHVSTRVLTVLPNTRPRVRFAHRHRDPRTALGSPPTSRPHRHRDCTGLTPDCPHRHRHWPTRLPTSAQGVRLNSAAERVATTSASCNCFVARVPVRVPP
jgi:hypothetical protein